MSGNEKKRLVAKGKSGVGKSGRQRRKTSPDGEKMKIAEFIINVEKRNSGERQ